MNQESKSEDLKSYFCSSLVAKLYKNLDILDNFMASTQYMPSTFTEK